MTQETTIDELSVPHRPDVPGLRFRHWRGLEDLAGMAAANQLARDDAGVEEVINVKAMTRTYTHLVNCDLARDLAIVERDGRTIGYVRVGWSDLTNGGRQNEAFRDHWGSHEWGDDRFRATFAKSELDTSLWVVAWEGDQVAGVVENWVWPEENEKLGIRRGWLEQISVRRPWRRRGLARAITAASLVRLREAGLDDAMLGVDSENANGALGLYEGLGFVVDRRSAAYRRPIPG